MRSLRDPVEPIAVRKASTNGRAGDVPKRHPVGENGIPGSRAACAAFKPSVPRPRHVARPLVRTRGARLAPCRGTGCVNETLRLPRSTASSRRPAWHAAPAADGRWCTNRNSATAPLLPGSLSGSQREGFRHSETRHSVQEVASSNRFSALRLPMPRTKPWAHDRLVPKEGVLRAGLLMVP